MAVPGKVITVAEGRTADDLRGPVRGGAREPRRTGLGRRTGGQFGPNAPEFRREDASMTPVAFTPAVAAPAVRGASPVARRRNLVHGVALALGPAISFGLGGCGDAGPSGRSGDRTGVTIDTIGDTVVVRTLSGGVWGDVATLAPEASIGELDGPREYLLGSISSIARGRRPLGLRARRTGPARPRLRTPQGRTSGLSEGPARGRRSSPAPRPSPCSRTAGWRSGDAGVKQIKVFGPGPGDVDQWRYSTTSAMSYTSKPLYTDAHARTFQTDPGGWNPPDGFDPDQIIVLGAGRDALGHDARALGTRANTRNPCSKRRE